MKGTAVPPENKRESLVPAVGCCAWCRMTGVMSLGCSCSMVLLKRRVDGGAWRWMEVGAWLGGVPGCPSTQKQWTAPSVNQVE